MLLERKMILEGLSNLTSDACTAGGTHAGSLLAPWHAPGGHANVAEKEQGVQRQQRQSICSQEEKELQVFCCSHNNKGKCTNNQGLDSLDLKLTPKVDTFMLKQ